MPGRRGTIWSLLRVGVAVVIVAAIVAQLARSVDSAIALDRDLTTTVVNFFSFFTILSNLSAAVALAAAGIWWLARGRRGGSPEPRIIAVGLVSTTTYMIITGVVYNALLRSVVLPQGSEAVPWSNEVLHLIGPAFMLVDALIWPARRLPWRTVLLVLGFPIVWISYTLVRGPHTVNPTTGTPWWYPYPFLDPNGPQGAAGVVGYVAVIAAVVALVAAGVVAVGRRPRRLAPPETRAVAPPPAERRPPG